MGVLCVFIWIIDSIPGISDTIFKCLSALLIAVIPLVYISFKHKDSTEERFEFYAFLIILAGFLFHAFYIFIKPYNCNIHDLGKFTPDGVDRIDSGHLGYISYLYNNRHLPDFDPREVWSFYNPPGFHIVSALWYGFNRFIGIPYRTSLENLQIITLAISTGIIMAIYKIMLELFPKNKNLLLMLAFVSFFPFFTYTAAAVNNDGLAAMLYLISILYTIRWHRTRDIKNICMIAVTVGLGMFTKINNALIAIPIGFLFIYDIIKDRKNIKKYILQYALFIVICAPLGLFWSIRNYVLYKIPPNYVQRFSSDIVQYMGNINKLEYIGLPSLEALTYPFPEMTPYYNHNLWLQLIKTSIFDEYNPQMSPLSIIAVMVIFMWSAIAMWIMSFVSHIRVLFNKKALKPEMKFFFSVLFITQILSIVKFTFEFPFTFTMHFRYVMPMILMPCVAICALLNSKPEGNTESKYINRFMLLFVFLSMCCNVLVTIL